MAKKPPTVAKVPNKDLSQQLVFNPHIWWDPVPPWVNDPAIIRELTTISLEHQKEMLNVQSKTIDKAINAIKGGR